jgi:hypothetical protein
VNRSVTVLDQIRTRLMDEAEQALVHAEATPRASAKESATRSRCTCDEGRTR